MNSTKIYNGLPTEFESVLIEKYSSFLTTCAYLEVYCLDYEIYYMVVSDNDEIKELLVFGNKGRTSFCFNSLVSLDQDLINEFTKSVFEKFPGIQRIKIDASYSNYNLKRSILIFESDDQILKLPSTIDEYLSNLSSKQRKNLRCRIAKLSMEFKNVNFVVSYGKDIEKSVIDQIILFNRCRMKNKGKVSGIDNEYRDKIYRYSRYYGCVAYLELDGVIVAGCVATIINKDIFLHVNAYDENFSGFNVGEICAYNMIQLSIEKGLTSLHFLWGKNELKRRFLAESHDLYSYFIYRNYSLDYMVLQNHVRTKELLSQFKQSRFANPIKESVLKFRKHLNADN